MDASLMETYTAILREELIPAMGCTEPIALAYAAAKANLEWQKGVDSFRNQRPA